MINEEQKTTKSINDIPGFNDLGIYSLIAFRKNSVKFLHDLKEKYGEISKFKLGKTNVILISNPELIKDVFVTNHHKFIKSKGLQMAKSVLGEGLLTSEHELHAKQRKMIQPSFSAKKVSYYSNIMTDYALKYNEKIVDGSEVDIASEMMSLTLDIACKTLFDADVRFDIKKLQDSLSILIDMFEEVTNPFYYLLKNTNLPKYKRFHDAKEYVDKIILDIIKERRGYSHDRNDLLSTMLNSQDDDEKDDSKKIMSDSQIKDETLTLFMAGHETTANLLTWTLYLISQNPRVEAKILDEINKVLGDNNAKYEDIHNFQYLRKVLTESMRLFPPAWIIGRINTEDHILGNYYLPKNTVILASQYLTHRDSKYYKSPTKFIPERWDNERKENISKYTYFPFGIGPRVCIGEQFAWAEAILILSTLLKKWKFILCKNQKVDIKPLITMRPKYGMKMIIKER